MGKIKQSKQVMGAEALVALNDFAPPTVLAQASRINFSTRLFNLIVTNVPGPQFPLYVLGRELETVVPVAFLPEKHALAVAIFSYNGKMSFGLLGDLDAMDDIDVVARGSRSRCVSWSTRRGARPPRRAGGAARPRTPAGAGRGATLDRAGRPGIMRRHGSPPQAHHPPGDRAQRRGAAGRCADLHVVQRRHRDEQPSDLLEGATPGKSYELTGKVAQGSVRRGEEVLSFRVRDRRGTASVPVRYTGAVPDPFREGREVIVKGEMRDGVFVAEKDSLVTKCPSKFTKEEQS